MKAKIIWNATQKSIAAYKKAIALDPDNAKAYENLQELLQETNEDG